ncbi:MAG: hypothetical protein ACLP9L_14085 [Thermoguttaceae bacterium]
MAFPRFSVTPGSWWGKEFPDEVTMRPDGTSAGLRGKRCASFASTKYRELARGALRAFLTHREEKYGDRIIGYFPGMPTRVSWPSTVGLAIDAADGVTRPADRASTDGNAGGLDDGLHDAARAGFVPRPFGGIGNAWDLLCPHQFLRVPSRKMTYVPFPDPATLWLGRPIVPCRGPWLAAALYRRPGGDTRGCRPRLQFIFREMGKLPRSWIDDSCVIVPFNEVVQRETEPSCFLQGRQFAIGW